MIDISLYCKQYIETNGIKNIRSNGKQFYDLTEDIIQLTSWSTTQNFTERVFCLAYNITSETLCKIRNKPIIYQFNKRKLYKVGIDRIVNSCYLEKSKQSILHTNFNFEYNFEYCDKLVENTHLKIILRTPGLVNHCFVWLIKHDIDITNIHTNEEACYLCKNRLTCTPVCPETGKTLKFNSKTFTYNKYYDKQVANTSQIKRQKLRQRKITQYTINKRKNTNTQKYGVSCPLQLEVNKTKAFKTRKLNQSIKINEYKQAQEKIFNKPYDYITRLDRYKHTNQQRYGVDAINQLPENKIKFRQQMKDGLFKKYQTYTPQHLPDISKKRKDTNVLKYGATYAINSIENKAKRKDQLLIKTYNNFKRFANNVIPQFTLEYFKLNRYNILPWKNVKTGEQFNVKYYGYEPVGHLSFTNIEMNIKQYLDKMNINYIHHTRSYLQGNCELDFYLPDHSIGIECNGLYFHTTDFVDKQYHLKKHNLSDQQNIKLLQFFGHEIIQKPKIVNNIIKSSVCKNKYTVHGRKCTVMQIESDLAKKFCNKYHIQGFISANKHYGIFYKNRIIGYGSFSQKRFNKNKSVWELIRFCKINNFTLFGGLAKIIAKFENDTPQCKTLVTFADKRLFTGKTYLNNNMFVKKSDTPPSYFYTNGNSVLSRYQCQKHKLFNMFNLPVDTKQTEEQIMNSHKFHRVYDCGHYKFIKYLNATA